MALSEGLHIERTEFLIADQSKDAQDLMIELPGDHRCHRRAASLQPRHVPASAEIGPYAWPLDERAVSRRGSDAHLTTETKEFHEGRTYRPLREQ